jgi:hypothetical protein
MGSKKNKKKLYNKNMDTLAVRRDLFILQNNLGEKYPLNFNWSIDELIETLTYFELKDFIGKKKRKKLI